MPLTVLNHPVAGHLLNGLRDASTPPERFRRLSDRLTQFLAVEATRDLKTAPVEVTTPLETVSLPALDQGIAIVAILRAGLAMVPPFTNLIPDAKVGYVGLERDEETAEAHAYYCKLPPLEGRRTIVVDPMLATGGSAAMALHEVMKSGADDVQLVCIVAAPEGVAHIEREFPGIPILVAALDRQLNDKKYIMPGLGDFGDRLFGT